MKECFKCSRNLPLSEFYPHPCMRDKHLNKCKDCTKADVRADYDIKREQKSAYERSRNQRPERRVAQARYSKARRARSPEKDQARNAVSNAIRDGRLTRQPCRICGSKAQAHHEDYSKPLEVDWLCFKHHREEAHGQVVIAA